MATKAIGLLLLSFGALSEAIRCYQCTGQHYSCSEENQQEVECNATVKGCTVEKKTGPAPHMLKYCAMDNDLSELACVQGKTGQSGDCVKGTEQEITQYYRECSADSADINSLMLKFTVHSTEVRKRSAFNVKQNDAMMSICVCRTSLCNTDDLGDGDEESPSTQPTNPTNGTTAPTKTTESNTTPSNPTNGTSAPTIPTDATTTPNTPTTTLGSTTPSSPTHSSSVSSTPANVNSTSSTPANVNSTSSTPANVNSSSSNTNSGNTLPATTPKSSGGKIINAGALTVSVIFILLTNHLVY